MTREKKTPPAGEDTLIGRWYVPSELRKGYQPKPPVEQGVPTPPPGPAGDVAVDAETLPAADAPPEPSKTQR